MMKSIFFGIVTLMFAAVVMHQEQASVLADAQGSGDTGPSTPEKWDKMASSCSKKLSEQIKLEFEAAIFYVQYAAYFGKATVNLPGFEKFFFNAASEEREHGIKLMEYAHMRGQKIEMSPLAVEPEVTLTGTKTGLKALNAALDKERKVTASIRELIEVCENPPKENPIYNDYHLVDYLTGEFLEEQHKGQRELAGKIAMLDKMLKTNPDLGEFIFDKQNM